MICLEFNNKKMARNHDRQGWSSGGWTNLDNNQTE